MTMLIALAFAFQAAMSSTVVPAGTCLAQGARVVGVQPIVVGDGVAPPKKVRDEKPAYPRLPKGVSGSGNWLGEVLLGIDGKVAQIWTLREVHLVPPVPSFNAAIGDAIRQWEYEPVMVNSRRTPVCMTTSVIVDWR